MERETKVIIVNSVKFSIEAGHKLSENILANWKSLHV